MISRLPGYFRKPWRLVISLALLAVLLIVLNLISYFATFVGNEYGYAHADQTVVPRRTLDSNEPIAVTNWHNDTPQAPPNGAKAITPPVTEPKARAYIADYPMTLPVRVANLQLTGVNFITVGDLEKIFDDPLWNSWPSTEPMVFVTMTGSFIFFDMDGISHTYSFAYRVFDGRTGNEIRDGLGSGQK